MTNLGKSDKKLEKSDKKMAKVTKVRIVTKIWEKGRKIKQKVAAWSTGKTTVNNEG